MAETTQTTTTTTATDKTTLPGVFDLTRDARINIQTVDTLPEGVTEVDPKTTLPDPKKITGKDEEEEVEGSDTDIDIEEEEEETKVEEEEKEEEEGEAGKKEEPGEFLGFAKYLNDQAVLDVDLENEEITDDLEGFQKAVELTVNKKIEAYKNSFKNPTVKSFIDYIEAGGEPAAFLQAASGVDYSKITQDSLEENEDLQKRIVRDLLHAEGYSPEEITEEMKDYEDSGILESKARRAVKKLTTYQEEHKESLLLNQKKELEQRQAQYEGWLTNLEKDIDKRNDIAGFDVSKKQKKEFFDYMTAVDKKTGMTALQKDSSDPENQLKMAWFYYNGFNFNSVKRKAANEEALKLKEKLGRYVDGSTKLKSTKRTPSSPAGEGEATDFSVVRNLLG